MKSRVGVYVCHCGTNIAGKVDVKKVSEILSKHPLVTVSRDYPFMCSSEGQELIKKDIREHKLTHVVVASCSPRFQEEVFRHAVEDAGLNPGFLEMANIREHVSWSTEDSEEATEKAIKYTLAAVEKVVLKEPIERIKVPVIKRALVIGGGVAGIFAALDLAESGIEVVLVEKEPSIGGLMAKLAKVFPTGDCAPCILAPLMAKVAAHPLIKLYTYSEIEDVEGSIGNFRVKILRKPRYVDEDKCIGCEVCVERCIRKVPNEWQGRLDYRKAIYIPFPQAVPRKAVIDPDNCLYLTRNICGVCARFCPTKAIDFKQKPVVVEERVGAIIVATGLREIDVSPLKNYGYGMYPDVLTQLQLERIVDGAGPTGGKLLRPSDKKPVKKIFFVQCVGSRNTKLRPYCSGICCMITLKYAWLLKKEHPELDVYVAYIDIRAPRKGYEELYKRARELGVKFIRGKPAEIWEDEKGVHVRVYDVDSRRQLVVTTDLVVLAAGVEPNPGTVEIGKKLHLSIDTYGFIRELHVKTHPVHTSMPGIFVAGGAQGPKDIADSIAQAKAAASEVMKLLVRGEVEITTEKAFVDQDICKGCMICSEYCPFSAIKEEYIGNKRVARVDLLACAGCGICEAACPVGAINRVGYTNTQIYKNIEALVLEKPAEEI